MNDLLSLKPMQLDALRARGITSSAVLDEGILVWAERGYPMVATSAEPAKPR